jgi:ribosomal protein S18 acetylase RimI-like enzyme
VDFRVVGQGDEAILTELFAHIDETFFRPHRFTGEQARRIAGRSGQDLFVVLVDGDQAVAYGMLRGWDEGYTTPSLGLAVRNDRQGQGLGRIMMERLHSAALARGASSVRLRVHPDNTRARRLYETLGYTYRDEERGELVMEIDLDPSVASRQGTGQAVAPSGARSGSPEVHLFRPEDPSWEASLLSVRRSIFHTAGYHAYAGGSGLGEPYLAIVGDSRRGLAWPYLLRPVAEVPGLEGTDATDVHSVYGYSGPVAWGLTPGDPFIEQAWRLIIDTWRSQGAVSAFSRFNPILENAALVRDLPLKPDQNINGEGVIAVGPTVSVDLTVDQETVHAAYGRGLARDIRVARRSGLRTVFDEDLALLPAFTRLYQETMARIGASDDYYFSLEDFRRLRDALGGKLQLLATVMEDTVVAAGLFMEFGGVVEWYLGGSHAAFSELSPTKVLVDDAIGWARDRGNRILHMGGGHGGRENSLLWFKSRFSPQRHIFSTGRWVLEPQLYNQLVGTKRASVSGQGSLDPNFFPAYRAPFLPGHAS